MRQVFQDEIDNLSLQVEVMALLVGTAIDQANQLASHGDSSLARAMIEADDEIDHMHTSLTEKCIEVLVREQPVASDLRRVLAVMRVVDSLERMGDLALRVAHQAHDIDLINRHPAIATVLHDLRSNVLARYQSVSDAWSSGEIEALAGIDDEPLDQFGPPLLHHITELEGADAARVAVAAFVIGRSFDRIGDHTAVIGNRLRFMVTGDVSYLAAEVG